MKKTNAIMVSIICLVYNHEKFLEKTLFGFVNQKTNFKYEVIVHDDASTDNSVAVIKKYQEQYPDIIKPVFQHENCYGKIPIIKTFVLPLCKGKYLAWCEGDDFWTDENKLQKQVDALENNPSCVACLSRVALMTYKGNYLNEYIPQKSMTKGVIDKDDFVKYVLYPGFLNGFPIQLSGFMIHKSIYIDYITDEKSFKHDFRVGDIPLALYSGLRGNIYYFNEVMSRYRTGNPNSWLGKAHINRDKSSKSYLDKVLGYQSFDKYTDYKYHDIVTLAVQNAKASSLLVKNDLIGLKKEYPDIFRNLPKKRKIKLALFYYFPALDDLYKYITRIRNLNR